MGRQDGRVVSACTTFISDLGFNLGSVWLDVIYCHLVLISLQDVTSVKMWHPRLMSRSNGLNMLVKHYPTLLGGVGRVRSVLDCVGCWSVQTNPTPSNRLYFSTRHEIMAYCWSRERKCWTSLTNVFDPFERALSCLFRVFIVLKISVDCVDIIELFHQRLGRTCNPHLFNQNSCGSPKLYLLNSVIYFRGRKTSDEKQSP